MSLAKWRMMGRWICLQMADLVLRPLMWALYTHALILLALYIGFKGLNLCLN